MHESMRSLVVLLVFGLAGSAQDKEEPKPVDIGRSLRESK
jgi:hypothetical protein